MPTLENLLGQYPGVIAGVVVGLVSLLFSVIISSRWRTHKEIAYEILSKDDVWRAEDEFSTRLRILFDDKPLSDLQLVTIQIRNSGKSSILPTDQSPLIKVSFEETVRILDAIIVEASPRSAKVTLKSSEQELLLAPLLLNCKDWVNLRVLLTGFKERIAVDGRFAHVKRVDSSQKRHHSYGRRITSDLMCFVMGGVVALLVTSLLANLNGLFR